MTSHRIVFVRHGQSVFNKLKTICGWYDTGLTEKGREQARQAGRLLKQRGYVFDFAFTSALLRARDTLSEMLTQMNCPNVQIRHAWQLNECHLGGWTGMTVREFIEKEGEKKYQALHAGTDLDIPPLSQRSRYYSEIASNPMYKGHLPHIPTRETFSMTMERSVPFWRDVIVPEVKNGRRVVVVSHKLTLKGLIKHLEKLTAEKLAPINLYNAAPFVYEFDANLRPLGPRHPP